MHSNRQRNGLVGQFGLFNDLPATGCLLGVYGIALLTALAVANIHVCKGSNNGYFYQPYTSMSSNIPAACSNNSVRQVNCKAMVREFASDVDVHWNLQSKVEA